jgi:hypothetical protein
LFPIFFKYHDNERTRFTIFPLLYILHNPEYRSFTLLPLLSVGRSTDSTRKHFSIASIYWQYEQKDNTTHILFPLWWNREYINWHGKHHVNVIFPLYWSFKNPDHINKVFFPIAWSLKNPYYRSFTFLPLFSFGHSPNRDQKHVIVSPLFWNIKNGKVSTTALFPILWHTKSVGQMPFRRNIVFPLWWSRSDSLIKNRIFFPFFWSLKNQNFSSIGVLPLFSYSHSTDDYKSISNITPLFWKFKNNDEKISFFIPFFYSKNKEGDNGFRRSFVFPFWYSYRNNSINNRILFPFAWSFKNPDYRSITIFPLFSAGRSVDGFQKHRVITPLFWSFKDIDSHKTVLFPVFDAKSYQNGDKNFGIFYFLFRYKKEDSLKRADFIWPICQFKSGTYIHYFRLAPLIWYKKTTESRFFSFQPFYYRYKNSEFADYHLLWQLFTFKNTFGKQKSWNFLWKALYYEKYKPKGHEFRFLYLVFADVKKDSLVEKSFFPFYYFSKESNGNRSLSLFLYFYNSFRRQLPNSLEFYKEERIFWFIRLRSNYKRLKAEGKL